MNEKEFRLLLSEIRVQLNRYGLTAEFDHGPNRNSRLDIEAIRVTIEREEKSYPLLSLA
jgi:hypothetical protein